MEKLQVYKCSLCGNVVELTFAGGGPLSCCGKPMNIQKENTTDGSTEKHVPMIEKQANGYLIKVGSVAHPMLDNHYIEWIEVITSDGKCYKKFLKPGDKPEAFFEIKDDKFIVREYCNIHGLWKNEK